MEPFYCVVQSLLHVLKAAEKIINLWTEKETRLLQPNFLDTIKNKLDKFVDAK